METITVLSTEPKQLTVSEALAQGYTHYVFNSDGFQSLKEIKFIETEDLKRDDIVIVEKEPYHPMGIDSKSLAELIAEHLEVNHSGDTGDDTEQVYNAIKEIDFSEAVAKIDEALSKLNYYTATDIKLVPDTVS